MALNQPAIPICTSCTIKKLPHNPLASTCIYNYKHRQTQLWQQIIEFQIIVKPIFTIIIYRQGHTIVLKTCAKHVLLYMSAEYAAAKCIHEHILHYTCGTCTTDTIHTHTHTYKYMYITSWECISKGESTSFFHIILLAVPPSINSVKIRLNYNLEGFIQQK